MMQELHSTEGSVLTWNPPEGYNFFHLHGSAASAGVGILIRRSFLDLFDTPPSPQLDNIVPGRIGRLRLKGKLGSLDLYSVYLTTGDAKSERSAQCRALAKALAAPEHALSIIGGDWNFAAESDDRAILESATSSSYRDAAEHKDFRALMDPKGIFELTQDEFTHRSATGLSKIDRVYSNFGSATQLDHHINCTALQWPEPWVSAHRPLLFSCRAPKDKQVGTTYIDDKVLDDPSLHHRVLLHLSQLKATDEEDGIKHTGNRELVLIKRAVTHACGDISREHRLAPPPHVSDDGPNDLALIMSFLRAVKKQLWWRARTLARRLDCLSHFRNMEHRGSKYEAPLRLLQDKAMDLAKKAFVDELRREQAKERGTGGNNHDDEETRYRARRRGQVLSKLARLKPGSSTSLHSMMKENGEMITNTDDKLTHLRQHWSTVFAAKPHSDAAVDRWFDKAYPNGKGLEDFPAMHQGNWNIRKADIKKAISMASRSAPGPDGIPYRIWQLLGGTAVDTLWQAAQELELPDAEEVLAQAYHDEDNCGFNTGLLVFLPKKPSGHDEGGNPVYTAADTRPLCIVDTANRLIANAARLRWEQNLNEWLDKQQHGFLPRRSMLANVVELEGESMHSSLRHQAPATVLFDFSAAFPSISQKFLFRILEKLGFPRSAVRLIRSLYHEHRGQPVLEGSRGDYFDLTAGIRQGCPLSPLLFVVAVDGLLRRVALETESTFTRMFADDTAMVLKDFRIELPILERIFQDLRDASHLALNTGKCIFIPLFEEAWDRIRSEITRVSPGFHGISIQDHGKYLGYFIGPGKGDKSWTAALNKAEKQVQAWDWAPLGLFYSASVWNTFIIPIMGFVAQLESPPSNIQDRIAKMLRRAARGPGNWCQADDVLHLKRAFGFQTEYKDIRIIAMASMFRTAHLEDRWSGGLRPEAKSDALRESFRNTAFFERSRDWASWHDKASVHQMSRLLMQLRQAHGITRFRIEDSITKGEPRPWSTEIALKVQKSFQKHATEKLYQTDAYDSENRVRQNLKRFGLLDRREAEASLTRLRRIGRAVPPRVWAATHGCIWNRWATARRRQLSCSKCLLGCEWGEDSVEHYAQCRRVHEFATQRLHLHCRFARPLHYWMLATPDDNENIKHQWWERMALLHYAVLRTTNAARLCGGISSESVGRALWQATLEGAKGSNLLGAIRRAEEETRATQQALEEQPATTRTPATPATTTTTTTTTPEDRFRHFFRIFMDS